MDIMPIGDKYVIYRGRGDRMAYFSFYVDGTGSSWSQRLLNAQRYSTVNAANGAIARLRERARLRRAENQQPNQREDEQ